jgi:uncharacterized protein (UPF0212 family)
MMATQIVKQENQIEQKMKAKKSTRHKWINSHGLEYHHNEDGSTCTVCGLTRLRLTYLKGEPSVVYYYPNKNESHLTAPKCKYESNTNV